MKGIGGDRLLQPGLLFAIMLALFLSEAAITSLTPIDFIKLAVPKFLRCQRIGNGLSTEAHEIRG